MSHSPTLLADVPVTFVHGFASTIDHNFRRPGWFEIFNEAGRKCIGVDLPGHGTRADAAWPDDFTDIEYHLLDEVDAPVIDAVGFSAGALILLNMLLIDPDRFRRITLIGIGDYVFGNAILPLDNLGDRLSPPVDPADVEAQLFVRLATAAGNDVPTVRQFINRPEGTAITLQRLARARVPVLVILGANDFVGPAHRLVSALPQATLLTLTGADHFSSAADYRTIAAALDFLCATNADELTSEGTK